MRVIERHKQSERERLRNLDREKRDTYTYRIVGDKDRERREK